MECTSCPGKDGKLLLVVVVVVALIVLRRCSPIAKSHCKGLVVLIFFCNSVLGGFCRFLIVADGYRDMLINSVLQC